ncbi:leucyl aminopeptidase [Candidatus Woesearchaeota archaeon]|nr:leucyl aminopeptidase [Candidatus Woesearchaeota archaeon]
MKTNTILSEPENIDTNLLVLGVFEKETRDIKNIDSLLNNSISNTIKSKEFEGEFKQDHLITTLGKIKPKKLLLIGLGKKKEYDLEKLRKLAAMSAKYAKSMNLKEFSSNLHSSVIKNTTSKERVQALMEGTILGLYQFNKYKTVDTDKIKYIELFNILTDKNHQKETEKAVESGKILAEAQNYVRDLVNGPASEITPTYLASEAKEIAKNPNINLKIYEKDEIKKKFGGLYTVGKGSAENPKMIVLDYNPNKKKTIVFVGKGITFDSGGLNLKPGKYMYSMKEDMGGAAVLLGLFSVLPKLDLNFRVIGIIPTCENMPSGTAMRPGDIITTFSKKTIEVIDTDAEGRLILSDGLSLADTFKPSAVIDIATLTGASIVVLGYYAAPVIGNNQKLVDSLIRAGTKTNERLWQLPLWDEYKELIKSDIADVRNISKYEGYEAGVITAAGFLEAFTESNWAHIDIGGTSWFPRSEDYTPSNATGFGVRLFAEFLKNYK